MEDRLSVLLRHLSARDGGEICFNKISAKPTFQYTLDNDRLSHEQRTFYEEKGYLVIKNLVPRDILEKCRQRFVDLCDGKLEKGFMTLMKDISLAKTDAKGEFLYNKVQDMAYDDVFSLYAFYPPLLDYVECFTGPNIMAMHSMLINKPPDAGTLSSRHPMHQDLHYFPFRPANRIVATWTAIDDVTIHNGCLFVLPATHKGILHSHEYPQWDGNVNKMYHGIAGYESHKRLNLEMNPGDTVFFHPLLIHGSGPNITKGFRKAISFHFAGSECEYINVKGTTQQNIADEIHELLIKKGMKDLDYTTVWRMKCRLIRGKRINL